MRTGVAWGIAAHEILVFASGFLVPQRLLGIGYFRGLEAHLVGRHATLFPTVPPVGTSEQRARVLANAIQQRSPARADFTSSRIRWAASTVEF